MTLPSERSSTYENFHKLAPEQQERILDACIEEFATHGYARASTNAMVKQAGIPKGTLFYFFGRKKALYLYILDRAIDRYAEQFDRPSGELPSDLFDRLMHIHQMRMQFVLSQPLLYRFFYNAFIHPADEIKADLEERSKGYAAASQTLLSHGLDRSKFREEVDVDKAITLITLMLEGLLGRQMGKLKDASPEQSLELVERLSKECEEYFEMIRKGIYRH